MDDYDSIHAVIPKIHCPEGVNLFCKIMISDKNDIFLKTNMDAGHAGKAGRYHQIDETAFMYSFILNSHNLL